MQVDIIKLTSLNIYDISQEFPAASIVPEYVRFVPLVDVSRFGNVSGKRCLGKRRREAKPLFLAQNGESAANENVSEKVLATSLQISLITTNKRCAASDQQDRAENDGCADPDRYLRYLAKHQVSQCCHQRQAEEIQRCNERDVNQG